jgi:hypothetical protein
MVNLMKRSVDYAELARLLATEVLPATSEKQTQQLQRDKTEVGFCGHISEFRSANVHDGR